MREYDKMIASRLYDPSDKELSAMRTKAHQLCNEFNRLNEGEDEQKMRIVKELFGSVGEDAWLENYIHIDYGINTHLGKNFYANFNLTILDTCRVDIGDDVMIGPNVNIVSAMHSLIAQERIVKQRPDGSKYDLEYGLPIKIGNGVWIGTGVTITGGVTIGDRAVIGAGSVVTHDIPSDVVAVGVPCKVLKKITQEDSVEKRK